jgi:hypothetical protein
MGPLRVSSLTITYTVLKKRSKIFAETERLGLGHHQTKPEDIGTEPPEEVEIPLIFSAWH